MGKWLLTLCILLQAAPTRAEEFTSASIETAGLSFSQFQLSMLAGGMGSDQVSQLGLLTTLRISPWIGLNAGVMAARYKVSTRRLSTSAAGDYLMGLPVTLALFRPLDGPNAIELDLGPMVLTDVRPTSGGGVVALALVGIGYRLWPSEGGFHVNAGFDFMSDFADLTFSGAHLALGYAF